MEPVSHEMIGGRRELANRSSYASHPSPRLNYLILLSIPTDFGFTVRGEEKHLLCAGECDDLPNPQSCRNKNPAWRRI